MPAGDVSEPELVKRDPIAESISALSSAVSAGSPLPTPAYVMLFPILAAVLSWPQWTPLHEEALSAVALHVSPGAPLPRKATFGLLYHVLQTLPSFRLYTACLWTYVHVGCDSIVVSRSCQACRQGLGLVKATPSTISAKSISMTRYCVGVQGQGTAPLG